MDAELIAVALPCLCEFVWVLRKVYAFRSADAALAIRALLGKWLGGETFISFDKKAVALLAAQGHTVRQL
jgi:predicted nucleic-acid-binding protein